MKYLLIILVLVSCSVEKKASKRVAWLLAHDKLSETCARIYPVRDSVTKGDSVIVFDTLYVEGDGEIIHDTTFTRGDTVIKLVDKKCPVQVINKTVYLHDTTYRRNTAEEERLRSLLDGYGKIVQDKDKIIIDKDRKISKNDWWKWAALITWFVVLLSIVFRIFIYKKPI